MVSLEGIPVLGAAVEVSETPSQAYPPIIDAYSDGSLFDHLRVKGSMVPDAADVSEDLVLRLPQRSAAASGRAAT